MVFFCIPENRLLLRDLPKEDVHIESLPKRVLLRFQVGDPFQTLVFGSQIFHLTLKLQLAAEGLGRSSPQATRVDSGRPSCL